MKNIILLTFLILFFCSLSHTQEKPDFSALYKQALLSIADGDTAKAQNLFLSSISEFDDAPSYYQLALIFQVRNSLSDLNIAREHIKKAIDRSDENILYHITFASILERLYYLSEFEFDARSRAVLEYEKIIELDSTYSYAWFKLGKFKRDDYLEYSNSYQRTTSSRNINSEYDGTEEFAAMDQVISGTAQFFVDDNQRMTQTETRNLEALNNFIESSSPLISYEDVAEEDFLDAEYYLQKAIETNPKNYRARVELGFLYEDADKPEEAIPYFKELVEENSLDKNAHLFLGLLYYEIGDLDESYESFQNALSLMDKKEFKDYTFYSVLKLLEPILGDRAKSFTNAEMSIFIDAYWKVRDPFNLTEYNERILEHYARVAYSNFRYGLPHRNIAGWQTDMGEMMIRFGKPSVRKRFRKGVSSSDFAYYDLNALNYDYLSGNDVKTEVWYYDEVALAFTDDYSTGNYKYHDPYAYSRRSFTQYAGEANPSGRSLVNYKPEIYKPKFNSNVLDVPYSAVQFRGNQGKTDVYINYGLPYNDSVKIGNSFYENHKTGLFYFDKYFHSVHEERKRIPSLDLSRSIVVNDSQKLVVNSMKMSLVPQRGNCAFELQRQRDKSVASFHGRYIIKNFSGDSLMISDILIASQVEMKNDVSYSINRGDISILPNPGHTFSPAGNLFIYFEVYNLLKNETGLTDFVQTIEVVEFEEEYETLFSVIGSFFELLGFGGDENIELTSNYQTVETDPKIYLQLDLSDYEPGRYLINVIVKDNISQKEKRVQSLINWQ